MALQATPRRLSLLAIVLTLAVLVWSVAVAPYVSEVGAVRAAALEPFPDAPVLLYRHQRVQFFYTSADLLHPEKFGRPGQFAGSVIFDILPAEAGALTSTGRVPTWILMIWNAIRSGGDVDTAESLRSEMGRNLALDRGAAKLFEIPAQSPYRQVSGISHFAAIAVSIPPAEMQTGSKSPQLFGQGMGNAFRMLVARNNPSAGVPRITVRTQVGDTGSWLSFWTSILTEVDALARATGMRAILYGGWSPDAEVHKITDSAFRSAWETHKGELRREAKTVTHEKLRLAALIVLAALLTWHRRGAEYNWKRIVALAVLAGGFAYSIAQAGQWIAGNTALAAGGIFALEAVMAIALGIFIESVVRFDPKSILSGKDGER
jgi:hypothetical protein